MVNDKVFCIGFNKTGTASLTQLFKGLGYRTIHSGKWVHQFKDKKYMSVYDFFSDGTPNHLDLEYLYETYPTSKFIYNTRNMRNWLISRFKHTEYNKSHTRSSWNKNDSDTLKRWIKIRGEWEKHIEQFFESRDKSRLCTIDIEAMNVNKLNKTLSELLGKKINLKKKPYKNKRGAYASKAAKSVDKVLNEIPEIPEINENTE